MALFMNPAIIGLVALFLSVLWMLRDERDRTRPVLVIALVLNLLYGWLLNVVLGGADSLLPWKYDYYLLRMDQSLGLSAASIAIPFQGAWRVPLYVIYQLMVPMMIFWYVKHRQQSGNGSVVLAYAAEMVAGPILYAVLPACGPVYAFGATWLHHTEPSVQAVRFSGMPNAFPSLHIATALLFVLFATGRLWRVISVVFLVGTALATITTGEHYAIDLIPGLAFGCFAASIGYRRVLAAFPYLGIVLLWSLAIRFGSELLITRPVLVRSFAAITLTLVIWTVWRRWRIATTCPTSIHPSELVEPDRRPSKLLPYLRPGLVSPTISLSTENTLFQSDEARP
ncbi:MAG TPA: phosphatase PAP2 family protein [Bryobacteraceae bacterium]|nr:phosphatase PAP2 family protein [Bryobacteraceae bacterium]